MRQLIALMVLSRALQTGDPGDPDDAADQPGLIGRTVGGLVHIAAPTVLDNIDLDAVVDQLDLDAIVDRLDLNALVDRLDLNAIVDRLDLDALVDRLDLDALVDRLDLDSIVQRLDINAIADQLDLDELIDQIDIAPLVGKGSTEVAAGSVDLARQQVIRFDVITSTFAFGVTGRNFATMPAGPEQADESDGGPAATTSSDTSSGDATSGAATSIDVVPNVGSGPGPDDPPSLNDVQGDYAGPISRLLAAIIDGWGSVAIFGLMGAIAAFFIRFIFGNDFTAEDFGWVGAVLFVLWLFAWYWIGQATTGRTPGKAVMGLKAVTRDDEPLGPGRAFVRVLVLPLSYLVAIFGFAGIVIGRERRALHDVAAGSTVIYDWGHRRAQMPEMRLVARRRKQSDADADAGTTEQG